MVENEILTAELAFRVLFQFDKTMTEAFKTQARNNVSIGGHLHTYQFYNYLWKFILHNAVVRYQNNGGATVKENVDRLKIVA
ncbi:hypothetical protein M0R45_013530 [Rubus argutus]|uniref:Transcription initiation factor IIA gamma subunit C-terminal domain-containing protein n=1 Tax=Rubus argutus TaxID=59490 RepID=A0AAW1XJ09_RUBAR